MLACKKLRGQFPGTVAYRGHFLATIPYFRDWFFFEKSKNSHQKLLKIKLLMIINWICSMYSSQIHYFVSLLSSTSFIILKICKRRTLCTQHSSKQNKKNLYYLVYVCLFKRFVIFINWQYFYNLKSVENCNWKMWNQWNSTLFELRNIKKRKGRVLTNI